MRALPALLPLAALFAAPLAGQSRSPVRSTARPAVPGARPGQVRVRLVTEAGDVVLALDAAHAPGTAANFLRYVDDGRLNGASFFRAARRTAAPRFGFVEGGIGQDLRRSLDPIPLEPTSRTGLRHVDGAISMARNAAPDSGAGNFSIMVGATPNLDARPGFPGYAVFGRVAAGMDTVRRILASPSGGGSGVMRGQMILRPVRILRAERLDGTPRPTDRPRVWLLLEKRG